MNHLFRIITKKQFDVTIQDKPGQIAHVADVLAKSDINIRAASTEKGANNAAILHIIADDDAAVRKVLKDAKIKFNERDVTVVNLPNKAGELAKVADKLSSKGLNIETLFILGGSSKGDEVAIGVDRQAEAEKVLGSS